MAIPSIPDVKTLMEAGVHFGHASGKWHPKMRPFIFATRDKLHIIDLEKTQEKLKEVLPILEQRIAEGKSVILVGSKKQVSDRVKQIGDTLGISYINVRWPGGVLTNFAEIQKSINRMKKTEEFLESDQAEKMIKKERVRMAADLVRMQHKFGGLRGMNKKPDALFIIDPGEEKIAIKEAQNQGIELFALIDTNSDPQPIHHLIPANDDGPKSLKLMLDLIEQTIKSGMEQREKNQAAEQKAKEEKAAQDETPKEVKEQVTTTIEAENVKE